MVDKQIKISKDKDIRIRLTGLSCAGVIALTLILLIFCSMAEGFEAVYYWWFATAIIVEIVASFFICLIVVQTCKDYFIADKNGIRLCRKNTLEFELETKDIIRLKYKKFVWEFFDVDSRGNGAYLWLYFDKDVPEGKRYSVKLSEGLMVLEVSVSLRKAREISALWGMYLDVD